MRCAAEHLYTGQLFASHLELACAFPARTIRIISAMYGVVKLDEEVEHYDLTISDMTPAERRRWNEKIAAEIDAIAEPRELVIVLAGQTYTDWMGSCTTARPRAPLAGMQLGERRSVIKAFCKGTRAAHDFDHDQDDAITYEELADELADELRIGGVAAPRQRTALEAFECRRPPPPPSAGPLFELFESLQGAPE